MLRCPGGYLHDFGGDRDAPVAHIAHANGLPPATYAPLAAMLTEAYRVVGLAARPLWSGSSPVEVETWHIWRTI
jgi:hypothetical protein